MTEPSYSEARHAFRWEDTFRSLGWDSTAPVDLARTIVDRHVGARRPALRWYGKDGSARDCSYEELSEISSRFAGWLRAHGSCAVMARSWPSLERFTLRLS